MANFTTSSSSAPPFLSEFPAISGASSSVAFDDTCEDSCSICLEPFSTNDPSTITSCKHEYHLHCILEWSQRSKECPICWQLLVLKDPASQELLAAVEAERLSRSRNVTSPAFTNFYNNLEHVDSEHEDSYSDDSDFDEHIMQHLVAAASRAHYVRMREGQRSSVAGPSHVLVFNSSANASGVHPTYTNSPESGGSSSTSAMQSSVDVQPPPSVFPPLFGMVSNSTNSEDDVPFKTRVLYSQPPPESPRRQNTSDMPSLSESIKYKLSAASARYKESISKSSRGLKEKLVARNNSVKELSKGVQREMNAGIAGVARMIERLDLTSKRSGTSSPAPSGTGGTSSFTVNGKSIEENNNEEPLREDSGLIVHDLSSDASLLVSGMVSNRAEVPPAHVQNGHRQSQG
ncbi:putative E3 ubiquitin-protein ligase RHF2A [Quillaja saponaria]|uniref:RING-type E3 ubiquitin transferase n=1 Tax=Quillaja saponaria TaxID=32244 RepID=A0AAD7PHC4_QUISA|nr:putative E3 ubiquitin-protein ligase RHF2A [Quillaja saponaria]